MWAEMKDWLLTGAIDKWPRLETDLTSPGLREDKDQRIWLESKKEMKAREVASPDEGDALCLTFAQKVSVGVRRQVGQVSAPQGPLSWAG
jgi:phage terminase large subunit